MPTFRVTHTTAYTYDKPVSASYGQLWLAPSAFPGQRPLEHAVTVNPRATDLDAHEDIHGNRSSFFSIHQPHTELTVTSTSRVEVDEVRGELPLEAQQPWDGAVAGLGRSAGREAVDATYYRLDSPRATVDDRVRGYAAESFVPGRSLAEALEDLAHRIHEDFEFEAGVTTVTSTIDDLFAHGAGVCQDFAHLGVACVRSVGLPARYVSGYLETDPPPGQPKLTGVDVSHAWLAVMLPGGGWIDVDPTNDQFVNERYVTTGWGRDYDDVPPLKGVIFTEATTSTLKVTVDVARV